MIDEGEIREWALSFYLKHAYAKHKKRPSAWEDLRGEKEPDEEDMFILS